MHKVLEKWSLDIGSPEGEASRHEGEVNLILDKDEVLRSEDRLILDRQESPRDMRSDEMTQIRP